MTATERSATTSQTPRRTATPASSKERLSSIAAPAIGRDQVDVADVSANPEHITRIVAASEQFKVGARMTAGRPIL
jgi:hypothetical protein